jgi:filamentous hemagglutinin family protein
MRKSGLTRPALVALLAGSAAGEPQGERVVAGEASFARHGRSTTITAGRDAIIEYRSFDIGASESVRFVQPDAGSRVLNRVLGGSPTLIAGSLSANGQVYVVNEAGVYFGSTAVVNVGALHAAAGTITNADFLRGVDRFTSLRGDVRNEGAIDAGEIHLLGRRVVNTGSLTADGGLVTMTAGDEVLLGRRDGHLFVRVDGGGAGGSVEQAGAIDAGGGRVAIGAGDMFSIALRPTSRIRAEEVRVESHGAGTVRVEGAIDASSPSDRGGSVAITGEGIAVVGAEIDASGRDGGGSILIGGGFRGDSSVIAAADRLYVDPATRLRADATGLGDGGLIVAWSDSATVFRGEASARGAGHGGDGGLVEVSSPRFLSFEGRADTSSQSGATGTLLLDPATITIVESQFGMQPADNLLDDNQIPLTEADGAFITISVGALEALGNTNVLLEASQTITLNRPDDGALDFAAGAGSTVTFNTGTDFVALNGAAITTQGAGITINAGGTINGAGLNARGGDIDLTAATALTTSTLTETSGTVTYTLTNPAGTLSLGGVEAGGVVFNTDTVDLRGNLITAGPLDLTGLTSISVSDGALGATIGAFDGTGAFPITLDPGVSFAGPGGLRFVASTLTLPAITGLSELEVTAADRLTLTGDIILNNDAGTQGGRVNLREAAVIDLAADIRIDTDSAGAGNAAGGVLLGGSSVEGAGRRLTIDANTGTTDADGAIELGDVAVEELRVFGGELTLAGAVSTASDLGFAGVSRVLVGSDSSIATNGGDLSFGAAAVDGPGGLSIDLRGVGGSGNFGAPAAFGAGGALASLTIAGDGFTLPAVTTTGQQRYTSSGPIGLGGNLTSTAEGITFESSVFFSADRVLASGGGTGDDIEFLGTVNSPGAMLTARSVQGETLFDRNGTLGGLLVDGDARITAAEVTVTGDAVFGGDPDRDTLSISQGTSTVRSTTGDVVFNARVQGPSGLIVSVAQAAPGADIPVIRFVRGAGDAVPLGSLVLGGSRSASPEVATIVLGEFESDGDPVPGLSFELSTSGAFTMGPFEKLTALGSLAINAGGTAQLGDISTAGDLSVTSPDVLVMTRAAAPVAGVDNTVSPPAFVPAAGRLDSGTDFVVGGTAAFNGPVRLSDSSLPMPTIAEPAGQARIENILTRASETAVTLADLVFNRRTGTGGGPAADVTTALDARATGATTLALATSLAQESTGHGGALADADALAVPGAPIARGGDAGAGIGLRPPTDEESVSAAEGAALYVDTVASLADQAPVGIAATRVSAESAERLAAVWRELAEAVNQNPGDESAVLGRVRSLLGVAAERYQNTTGRTFEDADAFELFSSLRGAHADAATAVEKVRAIVSGVRDLGLSPLETERIVTVIVVGVTPEGMSDATVRSLIDRGDPAR